MVAINHNRVKARTNKDGPYLAFTSATPALDACNDQEMSASFIISTNDEDREGDIIEPTACLQYLDEYRRNPIVLFDHDQKKVVGSSEGPDRKFYFEVRQKSIWAKCFFHDCNWEGIPIGQETYHLVKKRIFRGASIGFLPLQSKKRGHGSSGTNYTGIRFTEWSVCPLQSNQNALAEFNDELRACLDRGEIINKSLCASLRKQYLPVPNAWANGAHILGAKGKSMSKRKKVAVSVPKKVFGTRHEVGQFVATKGLVPAGEAQDGGDCWIVPLVKGFDGAFEATKEITKGIKFLLAKKGPPIPPKKGTEEDEEEDDQDEGTDANAAEGNAGTDETEVPGGDADDGDDEGDEDDSALEADDGTEGNGDEDAAGDETAEQDHMNKPGAHILAEHMAHNEALVNAHDDRMSQTDSKAVIDFLGKSKAEAEAKIQEIIGIAKSEYPGLDLDSLADGYRPEDGGEEEATNDPPPEEDAPAEPVAKKLSKKTHGMRLKGAKDYLEDLSNHSGVMQSLRPACKEHAKCLGRVMKDMDGGDDDGDGVDKRLQTKSLADAAAQAAKDMADLDARLTKAGVS